MKVKFPKLQSFLIKPTKKAEPKEGELPKLNVSSAFVYKGHIIAISPKTIFFFNLKEYLKYTVVIEEDEDPQEAFKLINEILEFLEGRTLSKEFFTTFSKTQKIVKMEEDKIHVNNNEFHSVYHLDPEYDVDLLLVYLEKIKKQWVNERTEQGQFGVRGEILNSIMDVIKTEASNDSLVFERTFDDRMKFTLITKDFIFGVTAFDLETESSITKFGEATDFFELNID